MGVRRRGNLGFRVGMGKRWEGKKKGRKEGRKEGRSEYDLDEGGRGWEEGMEERLID